jgi:DNA-binding SARP family transcriptional activator
MTRFRIELLGGFSARPLDSGQSLALSTRKAQALLAYLALPAGRFHSRDKLTALLWGERTEAQARQSFRQALTNLRRGLVKAEATALLKHGDTIALNPLAVSVDVAEMEAALADGSLDALERAAALYRGDLLDGFSVDEPAFEEWRVVERERLHELALEGLARLLREHRRADRAESAIRAALRILALDPLQEAVHRVLMQLLLSQGRRAAALEQYQACVGWLERELGAEPEEETRQLYREILRSAPPAAGASAAAPRAAEPPIIGRGAELDRLRAALARMLDDGGHVVLVSGEAGIGKSRLIQEFAARAASSGVQVALGLCHPTENALPLHPWIDALRGDRPALDAGIRARLGATAGAELVRVLPELSQPEDRPAATGPQPTLLFDALAELVGELGRECPIVLVLEDLHWADAMSARFLAFMGRRVPRLPVLVVASTRSEELVDAPVLAQALGELRAQGHLEDIHLGPLSEADSRALAHSLRSGARKDGDRDLVAAEIWAASKGNPFVIVESVRALRDESFEAWMRGSRVAPSVRDFVAARLERLARPSRDLVTAAAAIGRDFSFALLARAAGVDERQAADAVEELVRRRVLDTVGERLDFCHDWIREVAYERALPARRAVLHAGIAEALEALYGDRLGEVADQLGDQYSRAGDARQAIPHLVRFAEEAALRHALDDAYRALARAIAEADRLPAAERDRCRLDLALRQAFVLSILGRQREILALLDAHAGDLAHAADDALAAEYYFRLGLTCFFMGDHARGQHAARQALEAGERASDPEKVGKALHVLSLTARDMGRFQDGIAHATRAVSLLDRPHTQAWLGLVYHDLALNYTGAGALDAALGAAARLEAVGRGAHLPRLLVFSGYVVAWILALRGDTEGAVETARQALEATRDPMTAGLVSGVLGHAYLEQGDAGSAVAVLERSIDQLESAPVRHGKSRYLALLGEAYLGTGDRTRARETAGRALALSQADGMPFNVGLAQRALGRIARAAGDPDGAVEHLARALATFMECGAAFEVALTRVGLGAAQAERGDAEAAREHLTAALDAFDAAGAPRRSAAARDLGRGLGILPPDP